MKHHRNPFPSRSFNLLDFPPPLHITCCVIAKRPQCSPQRAHFKPSYFLIPMLNQEKVCEQHLFCTSSVPHTMSNTLRMLGH